MGWRAAERPRVPKVPPSAAVLNAKGPLAIGVVTCRWTFCEDHFRSLISMCFLPTYDVASDALLLHVGNQTLSNVLRTLANEVRELAPAQDHLVHACQMFDLNRENRNLVGHLRLFPHESIDGELVGHTYRKTAHGKIRRTDQVLRLADIRSIADEIDILSQYLCDLEDELCGQSGHEGGPAPSLDKPAPPCRRTQTLQPFDRELLLRLPASQE